MTISPLEISLEAAARVGAAGLLVDTADKQGPGVTDVVDLGVLRDWVDAVHAAGLFAALAGRLRAADLGFVASAGADIAGVRGAACIGGRTGRVSELHVHTLRGFCGPVLEPNPVRSR
jgi:uncharacterized protein (UPF0264 family)